MPLLAADRHDAGVGCSALDGDRFGGRAWWRAGRAAAAQVPGFVGWDRVGSGGIGLGRVRSSSRVSRSMICKVAPSIWIPTWRPARISAARITCPARAMVPARDTARSTSTTPYWPGVVGSGGGPAGRAPSPIRRASSATLRWERTVLIRCRRWTGGPSRSRPRTTSAARPGPARARTADRQQTCSPRLAGNPAT